MEEAAPFPTSSSPKDAPNLLLAERQATHRPCQLGRVEGESVTRPGLQVGGRRLTRSWFLVGSATAQPVSPYMGERQSAPRRAHLAHPRGRPSLRTDAHACLRAQPAASFLPAMTSPCPWGPAAHPRAYRSQRHILPCNPKTLTAGEPASGPEGHAGISAAWVLLLVLLRGFPPPVYSAPLFPGGIIPTHTHTHPDLLAREGLSPSVLGEKVESLYPLGVQMGTVPLGHCQEHSRCSRRPSG